jgi:hypothetical protein
MEPVKLAAVRYVVSLALLSLPAGCGWPHDHFDGTKWRGTPEAERYRQANDLISSNRLLGLTSNEVTALLGNPDPGANTSMQSYVVKVGGSGFNQVFILDVRFDTSGKVVKVFVRGD